MRVSRRYLVAMVLLAVVAVAFGVFGTVAPPLAEEGSPVQPMQESSSESVGHFQNPPSYDSGWVDITTKCGQYVTLNHNLNTTDVVVDVSGKVSLDPMGGALAWSRTYGGTGSEAAGPVVQTSDGGYALAGYTTSYGAGGFDFWLVKTDAAGTVQWNKTYGGANVDQANDMIQTSDGGYALVGRTSSYGAGIYDFWLVKTNSAGTMQWSQYYGGTGYDDPRSVVQTSDGGYAIAGSTNSSGAGDADFWLVKTDLSGNHQWNKTYGGTSVDAAYCVIQTSDGGYALAGYTNSSGAGSIDSWLVKTDSAGTMQRSQTYGGTGDDRTTSLVQTSDGGYTLVGRTSSYGAGTYDFWLVKTDSAGNKQWSQTYGGATDDLASSLVQTGDGGYAIAGYTKSFGAGSLDFWLVKTDSAGNMQWKQTYGGTGDDLASSVIQTSDRGYALAGYTTSFGAGSYDFWLVKVKGEMIVNGEHKKHFGGASIITGWSNAYGGTGWDYCYSMVQTSDGGYALAGYAGDTSGSYNDFWLVKTDSVGTAKWSKKYGYVGTGVYNDFCYDVIQTGDGGYALTGSAGSHPYGAGGYDFWLVKTDQNGNMQWNKTYGGTSDDRARSVVQTSDGGYAIAGYTASYGSGGNDFWLVKTDSAGIMQWSQTYGGTNGDYCYALVQTCDGGYALAGSGFANLVKTDSAGTQQWAQNYGTSASSMIQTSDGGYALAGSNLIKTDSVGIQQWAQGYGDSISSVIQTNDGGYALAAFTSDFRLVKTDSAGTMQWSNRLAGGGVSDYARSLVQAREGSYVLAGYTITVPGGEWNFYLAKVDSEMGLAQIGLTNDVITLYRGSTDIYWNYVRVRIWLIKEPSWIYGDINMDGIVDNKDLYIIGRNYGKTFSLLSLTGIIAVAGIHTYRKRKQVN